MCKCQGLPGFFSLNLVVCTTENPRREVPREYKKKNCWRVEETKSAKFWAPTLRTRPDQVKPRPTKAPALKYRLKLGQPTWARFCWGIGDFGHGNVTCCFFSEPNEGVLGLVKSRENSERAHGPNSVWAKLNPIIVDQVFFRRNEGTITHNCPQNLRRTLRNTQSGCRSPDQSKPNMAELLHHV